MVSKLSGQGKVNVLWWNVSTSDGQLCVCWDMCVWCVCDWYTAFCPLENTWLSWNLNSKQDFSGLSISNIKPNNFSVIHGIFLQKWRPYSTFLFLVVWYELFVVICGKWGVLVYKFTLNNDKRCYKRCFSVFHQSITHNCLNVLLGLEYGCQDSWWKLHFFLGQGAWEEIFGEGRVAGVAEICVLGWWHHLPGVLRWTLRTGG